MRPEQREAARQVLVEAAGRQFRREGLAGIGIDAVARATGQTSGAIYAHFRSKGELFAVVVEAGLRRLQASAEAEIAAGGDMRTFALRYLSAPHRDTVEDGCLLPSLSADIARAGPEVQALYAEGLNAVAGALARHDPGAHARALAVLALCAGGILLARGVGREASDTILANARQAAAALAP